MKKKIKVLEGWFVPSSANNYRAKLLHLPSLVVITFLFLLVQSSLSLFALSRPSVLGYSSQITPEKIIELTNQERTRLGLNELRMNADLNEAARRKAADMFAFDYWSHNSPTGRDPWSFFGEVGYDYLYAGENLARDFFSAESVISAWLASPTHKENLINDRYQEIGVAVAEGELGGLRTTLVVQLFGTPAKVIAQKPEKKPIGEKPQVFLEEEQLGLERNTVKLEPQFAGDFSQKPVNPLTITKITGIFILGLLVGALVVDRVVAEKKGARRLSGDNLAHISFLLVIILIIFLSQSGLILESVSNL